PDAGTVTATTPNDASVQEIDVGAEPTRIARAGDRIFVTLKGERAVAGTPEAQEWRQVDVLLEGQAVTFGERGDVAGRQEAPEVPAV
ncbi:MAG: hypothetical protein KC656_11410, partial [Myxococcales bacterium]|nr:hypothetical protein [Myxococcales bacterium]